MASLHTPMVTFCQGWQSGSNIPQCVGGALIERRTACGSHLPSACILHQMLAPSHRAQVGVKLEPHASLSKTGALAQVKSQIKSLS